MRKQSTALLYATLVTTAALAAVTSNAEITEHPEVAGNLALLDRWIDAHQDYGQVPGISVGIVLDQDLIWEKSYGYSNVGRKQPATSETLYSICSISKLFTSIALMQQRDAGRLQLDDPVSEHLDWFDIGHTYPDSGPITIRSLLTHSSGLPRESVNYYWHPDFPFPDRQTMIQALADQNTLYPAQTFLQYSNLALTLVGEIAAAEADQPYDELIQQSILTPLGLKNTRTYLPEDEHGKALAYGYSALDRQGKRTRQPHFDTAAITPAAGFTSNVKDLARFAAWQFRLLENGGEEVLRASTLREMQRVQWMDPDWETSWGLGFAVRKSGDDTIVGHGGSCPGYRTSFSMMPKHKMAVVVLINANGTQPSKVVNSAFKLLGPALKKVSDDDSEPEPLPDYSDYAGLYTSQPWGGETAIEQVGERLVAISLPSDDPSKNQVKLEHTSDDEFTRVRDNEEGEAETWTFDRDESGAVVGVRYHGMRMPKVR